MKWHKIMAKEKSLKNIFNLMNKNLEDYLLPEEDIFYEDDILDALGLSFSTFQKMKLEKQLEYK